MAKVFLLFFVTDIARSWALVDSNSSQKFCRSPIYLLWLFFVPCEGISFTKPRAKMGSNANWILLHSSMLTRHLLYNHCYWSVTFLGGLEFYWTNHSISKEHEFDISLRWEAKKNLIKVWLDLLFLYALSVAQRK